MFPCEDYCEEELLVGLALAVLIIAWFVSWAVRAPALVLKSAIFAAETGLTAGAFTLVGLTGAPFFFIRKQRCGPVAKPVLPT